MLVNVVELGDCLLLEMVLCFDLIVLLVCYVVEYEYEFIFLFCCY